MGSLGGCSNAGTVLESAKGINQEDSGARTLGGSSGQAGANLTHSGAGGEAAGGATGGDLFTGTGGTVAVPDAGSTCASQVTESERLPADIYLMLDQSSSMGDPLPSGGGTWWSALQSAVGALVDSPSMMGTGLGVQYFPLNGVAPASCTADYTTPEVELGPLPGNAAAINRSVQAHVPTAFTPTAPALQGALNHMKDWAAKHPASVPAVVLVTDGFPTECDPTQITDIAAIARAAFSVAPAVRTFVIGFHLGQGGANLDAIAEAGGTGKAVLIDTGNIQAQFVTAMSTIVTSVGVTPLACAIRLPDAPSGQTLDLTQVSIRVGPAGGASASITQLESSAQCQSGDGWYFDDAATPSTVELCPHTCATAQTGARVELGFGCK